MINRIFLTVFLLLNFQFVSANIATDIAANVSADQAAINAVGLSADEIAKQLFDAGVTDAGVIASALVSAGFIYKGTVESALRYAGFTNEQIAIAVNNTPGLNSSLARSGASSGGPISLR